LLPTYKRKDQKRKKNKNANNRRQDEGGFRLKQARSLWFCPTMKATDGQYHLVESCLLLVALWLFKARSFETQDVLT